MEPAKPEQTDVNIVRTQGDSGPELTQPRSPSVLTGELHHFAKSLQRRWPNLPAGAKPIASNIIEQVKNLAGHPSPAILLRFIERQMTMFRERMQGEG